MDVQAALSKSDTGTILRVHAVPGSRTYEIKYDEWRKELRIKVMAQPEKGMANQDIVSFLSQYFSNPVIIAGSTSRSKKIRVDNSLEETVTILGEVIHEPER
ncbi:MAG: YggU family protein [Theionarchaea archaeon]|nr:YggU family protein [Theionarchaea archaeon]